MERRGIAGKGALRYCHGCKPCSPFGCTPALPFRVTPRCARTNDVAIQNTLKHVDAHTCGRSNYWSQVVITA